MPESRIVSESNFYRLVSDLRDHFGTLMASGSWYQGPVSFFNACLAELDTALQEQDYDRVLELAMDEGFDMDSYSVPAAEFDEDEDEDFD